MLMGFPQWCVLVYVFFQQPLSLSKYAWRYHTWPRGEACPCRLLTDLTCLLGRMTERGVWLCIEKNITCKITLHRAEQYLPSITFLSWSSEQEQNCCKAVLPFPSSNKLPRRMPWSMVPKVAERSHRIFQKVMALLVPLSMREQHTRWRRLFLCQARFAMDLENQFHQRWSMTICYRHCPRKGSNSVYIDSRRGFQECSYFHHFQVA